MPNIIGTPKTAGSSAAQWPLLVPPEVGANRVHFIGIGTEQSGGDTDDVNLVVTYNGVTYSLIRRYDGIGSNARALNIFAIKESDIQTAEAGSGGFLVVDSDDPADELRWEGFSAAIAVTAQDIDQSVDLVAASVVAGPSVTAVDLTVLDTNLLLAFCFASTPGNLTWTGATAVTSVANGFDVGLAQHAVDTDETRNISYSTDASSNFAPGIFAIALPHAAANLSVGSITPAAPHYPGDTRSINLSDATNATGKTLSVSAGAITVDSQDIDDVTFDIPDPKTHGDRSLSYLTDIVHTVDDAGDTSQITLQITPPVGSYHTASVAALGPLYDGTTVQVGDEVYAEIVTGGTGFVLDLATGNVSQPDETTTLNIWSADSGIWPTTPSLLTFEALEVSAQFQAAWDVQEQVTSAFQAMWNITELVSNSFQAAWDVNENVSSQFQAVWSIESDVLTVSNQWQAAWDVYSEVSESFQAAWNISEEVSNQFQARWSVESIIPENYKPLHVMKIL